MPDFTGSVQRLPKEKWGERPSVLDFVPQSQHGAIRDGSSSADATSWIQAGLDSLGDAGGGVLYLPWGVYPVVDIDIPSNVSLVGDGPAKTILKRRANLPTGRGVLNLAGEKSGFEALAIDGQVTTPQVALYSSLSDPSSAALTANSSVRIHPGAKDISLRRFRVFHSGGYAVHIDARTGNVWRIAIEDPDLHDNRSWLFGAVSGSEIYGSWTGGILAQGDGLSNNYAVRGLKVIGGKFRRGTGNQIWSHVYGFGTLHSDFRIQGNSFEDIGRDGIMIGAVVGGDVSGNNFRRIGYVCADDTNPGVPRWINGQWAVGLDTAGLTRGVNYSGNTFINCYGAAMDLDGFAEGVVSDNTVIVSVSGEPEYSEDSVSSWAGNYCYGAQVSNTNDLAGAGVGVKVTNNRFRNCGLGAVRMYASRRGTVSGNVIEHPAGAAVAPIILGNVGAGDNKRAYGNTVTDNDIYYSPGSPVGVVQEDANGFDFEATDVNRVYGNRLHGINTFEFFKHSTSGSRTAQEFASAKSALTAESKNVLQREDGYWRGYWVEAGVSKAVFSLLDRVALPGSTFGGPLWNVSVDAVGGVITTAARTTSAFDDAVLTGKVYADGFVAVAATTFDDDEANLLDDSVGLLRYNATAKAFQVSTSVLAGARVWESFGSQWVTAAASEIYYPGRAEVRNSIGQAVLSAAVANGSVTTVSVTDASLIEVGGYYGLGNEVVKVTGVSGSDLTVQRGAYFSTPAAHSSGASLLSPGTMRFAGARSDKAWDLKNGAWGGAPNAAVAYFRPASSGPAMALDLMPNGAAADCWIDICSNDVQEDVANWEALELRKYANGRGHIGTKQLGTGSIRPLSINEFGGQVSVGTSTFGNALLVAAAATDASGITISGSANPALTLTNGTKNGFLGLVTIAGRYHAGSVVGGLAIRNLDGIGLTTRAVGPQQYADFYLNSGGNVLIGKEDCLDDSSGARLQVTGFVRATTGFATPSTATDAIQAPTGGVTARFLIGTRSFTLTGDTEVNAGLSAAGQGRIFYDSSLNKFRVSQNGAAYVDLVGAAGVSSLTGTANQVNVSAATGAVTLSLPQSIHTGATPTFAGVVSTVFNSTATGTTIAFQTNNSNFQVNGNGVVSSAGGYNAGGLNVIDASRNITSGTILATAPATDATGIVISGSANPALTLTNGTKNGYFGLVTIAGRYHAGSVVGGLAIRNADGIGLTTRFASGDQRADLYLNSGGNVLIGKEDCLDDSSGARLQITGFGSATTGWFTGSTSYEALKAPSGGVSVRSLHASVYSQVGQSSGAPSATSGSSIAAGAMYWDTGLSAMRIFNGSTWFSVGTSAGVTSVTGTANQVIASASTGAITLSLPQNIHTGAAPTFAGLTSTGAVAITANSSSLAAGIRGRSSDNLSTFEFQSNAGAAYANFQANASAFALNAAGSVTLDFATGASLRGRITAAGNWLLGTGTDDSSGARLQVTGFVRATTGFATPSTATDAIQATTGGVTARFLIGTRSFTLTGDSQVNAGLSSAGQGRIYYDSTSNKFRVSQNGGAYIDLVGSGGITSINSLSGPALTIAAGTAISVSPSGSTITIANTGVASLAGTANQVTVSASTGAVTLSLPQNINTGANVTFNSLTLADALQSNRSTGPAIYAPNAYIQGKGYVSSGLSAYNSIQSDSGISCGSGANGGFFVAATQVINTSGQFVGLGINMPSYGVAASGFNPYSGVQYFGQTLTSWTIISALRDNGGTKEYKFRTVDFRGGVITSISAESGWTAF